MAMAVIDDDDDDDSDNECTVVSWQPNDLYDNGPNSSKFRSTKMHLDCIIVITQAKMANPKCAVT